MDDEGELYKIPKAQEQLARSVIHELVVDAAKKAPPVDEERKSNGYIDKLITNVKKLMQEKFEPLIAENVGEIKSIKVWGLSTISRTGKAALKNHKDGFHLEVNIGFDRIQADADFEKTILLFRIVGILRTEIKNIKMYGKVNVDLDDGVKPRLLEFKVTDWGEMKPTIVSSNFLGKVASWFPTILKNILKKYLPGLIKSSIDNVFAKVDFKFPVS